MKPNSSIETLRVTVHTELKALCQRYALQATTDRDICTKQTVERVLDMGDLFTPEPFKSSARAQRPLILMSLPDKSEEVQPHHMAFVAGLYAAAVTGLLMVPAN